MSRPLVNPGSFVWLGEHWINALRLPDADTDSATLSLYHTRYSAGGEGTVAFIHIPGVPGFRGACTDNREAAEFVLANRLPFDRTLPIIDATITQAGDIRSAPTWIIETAEHRIVSTWTRLGLPLVVEGFAPLLRDDVDFFALFLFAEVASITLNDQAIPGAPYLTADWEKTLGGRRSSCMFALAETMTRVPGR